MSSHQHKAGTLKQSNKKHKGAIASNRSVKRSLGAGKVENRNNDRNGRKAEGTSNMAM
jgi:hypothetical protein